jgi:hypothetical protein
MPSILPFIERRSDFDDELTKLMGDVFDAVSRQLVDTDQPPIVQEVLAKCIIEAVRRGERNPQRLRDAALSALGLK